MPDPLIILDAHLDIAYNTIRNGRDFAVSVYQQRRATGKPNDDGVLTVARPEAILGRVGLAFGTIYLCPRAHMTNPLDEPISYSTPREAYERGLIQWEVYERLAERGAIAPVRTQSDLARVLATWQEDVPFAEHQIGIFLSIEGADPILEPKQFEEWYERGVRAVGLAWMGTRYSGGYSNGVHDPGALTTLGRELLEVMAGFRVLLDLSHMSEAGCYESLDRYEGPIIASHSNARRFSDTPRHLTDPLIRRLAERDGVMGIPLYNRFLKPNWLPGPGRRAEVTIEGNVVAAIDYVCQLTGSARHVGIGSDLDGGFGLQQVPADMDTVSDEWLIGPALRKHGYSDEDVAAILSGNFLRKVRQALPE